MGFSSGWLRRRPGLSFIALVYAITWLLLLPLVLQSWEVIAWPPGWHALGAFGPGVAAIIVTGAWLGRSGLADFWRRRLGVLRAARLVWPVWALWHLPMFSYRLQLGALMLIGFALGLLAGALWLAYLYNRTGSTLAVALWHSLYNLAVALGGLWSADAAAAITLLVVPLAGVALWRLRWGAAV
jgi:hypothetical protein